MFLFIISVMKLDVKALNFFQDLYRNKEGGKIDKISSTVATPQK